MTPYPSSAAASAVRTQSGPRATTCARTSAGSATVYFGIVSPVVAFLPDRPLTPPLPGMPGMSGGSALKQLDRAGIGEDVSRIADVAGHAQVDVAIFVGTASRHVVSQGVSATLVGWGIHQIARQESSAGRFGTVSSRSQGDVKAVVGGGRGVDRGHVSVSVASDVLGIPKTYSRQQGSSDFSHTEHFYARAA